MNDCIHNEAWKMGYCRTRYGVVEMEKSYNPSLLQVPRSSSCTSIQRLVHNFNFGYFSICVSIEQDMSLGSTQVSQDVLDWVNTSINVTKAVGDAMDDGFLDVRNPRTAIVDLDEEDAICRLNKEYREFLAAIIVSEGALESEFDESQLSKASVELPRTTPGTGPHLSSSSAQFGLINGFTQH
ncbi:hypothetical protein NE237_031959 [Protea cynaroides]|uniref:Uncharacterized protein n=1 Tax=Protea cynaroides TaxID=273540 RepID=A0A9Q0L2E2_9MAGN|nr:hypothetical protein NE237_031959 [Protea cynaroides]